MNPAPSLSIGHADLLAPSAASDPAVSKAAERLSLLDDPQEWTFFGHPVSADGPLDAVSADSALRAGPWESQVVLEGMHCAACALTIEQALLEVPGVTDAQVNAATRRARVVWHPDHVLPSAWVRAVEAAGYQALPARDAFHAELRQREQRRALWRMGVAGFCMMQVMMYAWPAYVSTPGDMTEDMAQLLRWASWVLTLPVMIFACSPFFASAWRDVRQRRISMDLPVALGMAVTFVVSSGATFDPAGILGHEVYYDSLTMFVFFLLTGRWFELRLRDRTAGALEALMNRMPDSVERRQADGSFERVAVRRLVLGDVVRVLPGEGFPADGEVIEGQTQVDEALLTGESSPVWHGLGSVVTAGSHNLTAPVLVLVQRLGASTRFAEIVALMERASMDKPRLAVLADRWARPFLLSVLVAAGLAAAYWWSVDPGRALMVAVAVLIVTCPCALSLATPAAMLAAAGALARRGVLVRNLQGLEALAAVDQVVFDKTGTLTQDGMAVTGWRVREGFDVDRARSLASALASHSLHPVSRALQRQATASGVGLRAVHEVPGQGLEGDWQGPDAQVHRLRLGSARWCHLPEDVAGGAQSQASAQVHLADDEGWLASFDLQEDVRADALAAIQGLKDLGVSVALLSGDRQAAAQRVGTALGIEQVSGGCTPADKLDRLRMAQQSGHQVAMVGDGLNDGPVLAGAHVSFAFGQAVPLARSRSDFVVMGGQLTRIPETIALARRTLSVVRQNLCWAAAYNAVCVPLAVMGLLPAWLAGLGMAMSSLWVVLNAARLSLAFPSLRST
ncbi:cation-translocating P-type ATPase [Curvibacter sp. HBC28]|uniref:Cation-translocating P-type ATPase n=1 Tax=Curvibacter microcysteis TaxID=3026419 RepID=A0ABT5MFE8_9BURK|nr:cation-translocating P-type ATPase [Curvibacter sp. HBC28]MDD0815292.1 cation-translocating P-type ATPase [Curvibacter sp. HBC28]